MARDKGTFQESWYRIAGQHVSLRGDIEVRRQMYRGELWHILFDPFSNQFFRVRPHAYGFLARLGMRRTIGEEWERSMARDPDHAPGQEEVINLLAQLYHANLLHYDIPPDSAKLFERFRSRQQRIWRSTFLNIMFIRIPLFDPDNLLKRMLPAVRWLISPLGAAIWLLVTGLAVKVALEHTEELRLQSQGILAASNLFLLYIGLILIKALHEFGHALVCRRYGGEVHTMGVMFLIFNPLPFMDATSAWAFRSKWTRALVGASGMIVEVFVAALATFVWAATGPGVMHALSYNMVFIASVSTVLFNINPLLRFDGYYILSDALDIPNLHSHAARQLVHVIERYAFGCRQSQSPAASRKEATWLTVFGVASWVYRIVVFTTILLFVADRFLLAGLIMAVFCFISWVIVPCYKLLGYLVASPRLERQRLRAAGVCLGSAAVIALFFYLCPVPASFKAPGIVEAVRYGVVVNDVDGHVVEIVAPSGTRVQAGAPVVRMRNMELELDIRHARARLDESLALRQKAMEERQADLKPIEGRIESIRAQIARLEEREQLLTVRAPFGGLWIAPNLRDVEGMWLRRGNPLGQMVDDAAFFFVSVVPQQEAARLFSGDIRSARVRLSGRTLHELTVDGETIVPAEQTELPSASLGWGAGGDVAIKVAEPGGMRAAEPFYEVRARLEKNERVVLYHGRSGRIRFGLPHEPLLRQTWRRLRQLLQERYQI